MRTELQCGSLRQRKQRGGRAGLQEGREESAGGDLWMLEGKSGPIGPKNRSEIINVKEAPSFSLEGGRCTQRRVQPSVVHIAG